jgi:hypothetical protein
MDVEHGTGIPIGRLSAAERGKIDLSEPEYGLLMDFYLSQIRTAEDVRRGRQPKQICWTPSASLVH